MAKASVEFKLGGKHDIVSVMASFTRLRTVGSLIPA